MIAYIYLIYYVLFDLKRRTGRGKISDQINTNLDAYLIHRLVFIMRLQLYVVLRGAF
jgi:hypothetical protein